ncbi:MAG: imidazole glycerol phosphate synthase subunit HisH [Thermodesulfobacteriota bacterium]
MLAIIDYGMGNLRSIANAFLALGCQVLVTRAATDLEAADAIVLPGVGAFEDGMRRLRELGMIEALSRQVLDRRKPYLGVCLGMQFLASESHEHGVTKGLGWLPGTVERIVPEGGAFKVPHIGWNDVEVVGFGPLFRDLAPRPVFYFVHSYHLRPVPESAHLVTSRCWHGTDVVASVSLGHIHGVQFHPEKSQAAGLKLLRNFLDSCAHEAPHA